MTLLNDRHTWSDPSRYLRKIFVERSCAEDAYVHEIIERAGLVPEVIEEEDFQYMVPGTYPENLSSGKSVLLLRKNRGTFLKDCPSTRVYECCDYKVINTGMGCPMDCTYCILQAYLNNPYQTFFINEQDLFAELDQELSKQNKTFMRIGTGEFTDSMALDHITCMSKRLINYFSDKRNCILELKTKSAFIENLKGIDHGGKVVMSWSLNSDQVVMNEEMRAATIEERMAAAAICSSLGYKIAFHFDPIIAYPGWQKGYEKTIRQLFESVPAASICWISMGGFRYLPKLKQIGTSRFPQTSIYHHEFIEGLDSKQRYFRPLRVQLYKHLYTCLREYAAPDTCIYFCMESNEIWKEVMGYTPEEHGGLPRMLDASIR